MQVHDLLSLKEASILLQRHPNTLRLWDQSGILKSIRFGKRGDRHYRREDILSLLSNHKTPVHTPIGDYLLFPSKTLLQKLHYLHIILANLAKVTTPDQVIAILFKHSTSLLGTKNCFISLLHTSGNSLELAHASGHYKVIKKKIKSIPLRNDFPFKEAIIKKKPIFIEGDHLTRESISHFYVDGTLSLLIIPLTTGTTTLGIITASLSRQNSFTSEDISFIMTVVIHATQALIRTNLHQQAQQAQLEIEYSKKILRSIYESGLNLLRQTSTEKLYQCIVEEAKKLTESDMGSFYIKQKTQVAHVYPLNSTISWRKDTLPTTLTKPILLTKHEALPFFVGINKLKINSTVIIPLSPLSSINGILVLHSKIKQFFTEEKLTITRLFSALATLALR